MKAQTQKGKGIVWLQEHHGKSALPTQIIPVSAPKTSITITGDKLFVRACPVTPRHGVLESSACTPSKAQALVIKLAKDMEKAGESNGEIAVQPFIKADYNIVWGDGMLVIAPDHDGVTAGKHPQLTLRMEAPSMLKNAIEALNLDTAEMEFITVDKKQIHTDVKTYATQVRSAEGHFNVAPAPPNSYPGFSAEPINWKTSDMIIVKGIDDMIALEAFEKKDKPVLVVHYGGSIGSHASAWCRQKHFAYIALDSKQRIEKLAPWLTQLAKGWMVPDKKAMDAPSIPKIDWFEKDFFKGMDDAKTAKVKPGRVMQLACFFHQYASGLASSKELAYVTGYFCTLLIRATVAISAGEARHLYEAACNEGSNEWKAWKLRMSAGDGKNSIYGNHFNHSMSQESMINALTFLYELFYNPTWSPSYGGKRWAGVCVAAIRVLEGWKKEDRIACVTAANTLINVVHNGGWAFNKIATQSVLNIWKPEYYKIDFGQLGSTLHHGMEIIQNKLPKCSKEMKFTGKVPINSLWKKKPINYNVIHTLSGGTSAEMPIAPLTKAELLQQDFSAYFDSDWADFYDAECTCKACLAWEQADSAKKNKKGTLQEMVDNVLTTKVDLNIDPTQTDKYNSALIKEENNVTSETGKQKGPGADKHPAKESAAGKPTNGNTGQKRQGS